MDIQAYIKSGVLELYVIGQLSPREMREVEEMAAKHPEIKTELVAIEQTLEAYSLKNQAAPAPSTFEKITAEIQTKPIDQAPISKGLPLWLGALLGLLALLLAIVLFMLWNNNKQLEIEKAVMSVALAECETAAEGLQEEAARPMALLRLNGTQTILLEGTEVAPASQAAVYFNPLSQKSYLDPFQLPNPDAGQQYQLWALIDGVPTDMGVFDSAAGGDSFIEVPYIANADAFAITLEPTGGSVNPTLTALQVIGNRI